MVAGNPGPGGRRFAPFTTSHGTNDDGQSDSPRQRLMSFIMFFRRFGHTRRAPEPRAILLVVSRSVPRRSINLARHALSPGLCPSPSSLKYRMPCGAIGGLLCIFVKFVAMGWVARCMDSGASHEQNWVRVWNFSLVKKMCWFYALSRGHVSRSMWQHAYPVVRGDCEMIHLSYLRWLALGGCFLCKHELHWLRAKE